jgi:hypothetical protein
MERIVIAVLFFLAVKGNAQITLAYSGNIGVFHSPSFVPVSQGGYVGFKTTSANTKGKGWNTYRKSVSFVKYDINIKPVSEVKMTASGGICSWDYYELKKAGNKLWFIYLEPTESNDMGSIKAVEIDPVSLQQKEEKTLASGAAINHSLRDYRYTQYFDFMCSASPSGKYIYLCVQLSDKDNYLACFDENMKPLWGAKNKKPEGEVYSAEVDDAGYLYMSLKQKKNSLSCLVYTPSGQMNTIDINLSAGKARDIMFHTAKGSEQVVVTGTYMEDDNCTGVYKGMMNKKGLLSNVVATAFPKNIVESMKKEGFASTKEKKFGVTPSFCAAAVRNSDGNSTMKMIMEFGIEAGGGSTGVSTNLLGGSLIYVDFNNTEPVFTRVPKYSVGAIPTHYAYNGHYWNGCMYYSLQADSKLILFYYDNPVNLDRDPALDAKVVNPKNQQLVAAVINEDGTFKRHLVTAKPLDANGIFSAPSGILLLPIAVEKKDAIATVKL